MKRNLIPSYLKHTSGRARAVWTDALGNRHDRLLPGAFQSVESLQAYAKLAAETAASPLKVAAAPAADGGKVVTEVLFAYVQHALQHYRYADGRPTSEIYEVKIVVRAVRELYGKTPIRNFGPLAVKAMRAKWVMEGLSRTECNRRVGMIKRILKWGTSEELVPAAVYQAVATVTGLQRGRTDARETEPVRPVEDAIVDATLPYLNRHVRGLVEFQRLTGCRPGEACALRRSEIDERGTVWLYRPSHHKTLHKGKSRTIAVGPKGQELLKQFFTPNRDAYLFSPSRAVEELNTQRHAKAKSPRRKKKPARHAARPPKERYDRTSYTRAISRACEQAFAKQGELDQQEGESVDAWRSRKGEWRQTHGWSPNQLRHTFATKIRREHGIEAAQVVLGHSRLDMSEHYAEKNEAAAVAIAEKAG